MAITRDVTKVIKEPRKVFLVVGGVEQELGHTSGGIKFTLSLAKYSIDSDQTGEGLDIITKATGGTIETPLLQYSLELLSRIIPGSVLTIDGTKQKLEVGSNAGQSLRSLALPLILRPESLAATDKTQDIKAWLAVPEGDVTMSWNNEASKEVMTVTWRLLIDTTKVATKNLIVIGDESATA